MGKLLRRRSVLVATVLAIAATAAFAVVALADNPLGSGYDINGSVPDPGTSFFPDPVGSVQELGPQNGSGTKLGVIHTAVPPMLDFTDINGGVDLSGMWLDTNVATNGDVWLYFGFSRESATTGQVAFEFQQAPLPGACDFTNVSPIQNGALTPAQQALINNCNPWSGRQNGDFLVVFDTQGNSTTLNKRVFSGSSFGNPQIIPANVSAAAVAPNELTGEGAINLTASGIFPAQPTKCITFANVIAATVTGNSDSADFKDTILTDTSGVGISNCGEIRVTKDTDPEGGTGNFPYTITRADNSALRFDGSVSVPGTLTSDGDSDLVKDIKVGTNYKLAEGPLDPSWVLQSITCTKNGTSYNVVPGNANFSVDASTITECEIKNVPKPKLTLVKAVVNNGGGTAAPSAWTLTATGTGGFSGTANSAAVTAKMVNAGQQYTLSESNGPTGYATTGVWSCTGGGTFASPDKITLSNGDNVTCTITNDDVAPTLTLTKIVQNDDGGTKVPADWTLTATGSGGVSGASGSPAVTTAPVLAGVQYGLSESSVPGYSTTGVWSCTGGGTSASPDKITLSLGQNVTCTITNTDNTPTLKLVKSVTNNDGGSASAADFTLSAVAASGSAVRDFTSKTASPVFHNVFGATVYNLSESGPAGYTAGAWSCDGGTQAGASISVPLGGAVTCTIVNNDNGPQLKLVKHVVNDNGGPKTAADWTLSATSTGQNATRDFSYAGDTNLFKDVFAGVGYTLAEQGPAGYTAGAWQCSGGTLVGNVVTVSLGGQATCTITNNDVAPKLHLRKIIVNDNGGTATQAAFTLTANGAGSNDLSGHSPVDSDGTLLADTWALSENSVAGYAASAWDCVGGNQNGSSITVGVGGEATCTITNNDIAGHIVVDKVTVPSGADQVFDFTVTGEGYSNFSLTDAAEPNSQQVNAGLYSVSETALAAWQQTGAECDQGQSIDHIQVALDTTVHCTITNSKRPLVKVVKQVVPEDDGGTFNLGINDQVFTNSGAGFGDNQGTDFVAVAAGDVTVSENDHDPTLVSSYFNDVSCDSDKGGATGAPHANRSWKFTVTYGEQVTCTFTNTRKPSSIDVTKTPVPSSVNEPGGNVKYTVGVTNTSAADKVKLTESSFVDEVAKNDLAINGAVTSITDLDCNGATAGNGLPLTLAIGGSVTCTFHMDATGNAGDAINDRITVTGKDDANRNVSDFAEATVNVVNVNPAIDVQKTVKSTGSFADSASLPEPGGSFTYQVVVTNTSSASSDPLDITSLTDDIYHDITTTGHDGITATTCAVPQNGIPQDGTYTCTFTATFTGNAGAAETDTVTATGKDDEGNEVSDTDTAHVSLTDVPSTITVTKAPSPTSVPEPGGAVTYSVLVTNTSTVDAVTLTDESFTDKVGAGSVDPVTVDCNGATAGSGLPLTLQPSGSVTCTFVKTVSGNAGDIVHDEVTVTGTDDDGGHPTNTGTADVPVTDIPTKLSVVKDANPETVQEGTRAITFTITITNVLTFTQDGKTYTAVDDITVFSLQDDKLGDLDAAGDVTCKVGGVTKAWPITIGPGQSIVCTVTRNVTGSPSSPHTNTATATGFDSDHPNGCAESSVEPSCKKASDNATVTFTATPPPPYVPHSDVTVTKTATPAVQLPQGGGTAPITYNLAAKNNGPDAAQNVHVSDAAPADVTFISATTGKGTCTTTAQAVDCTISSLAVGESVPITINATVSATGTKTNVVVISNTTPPDTNPNNNTASASTVVTAPVTPPTPKPQPDICELLTVTPKVLKANGKAQKISVKVTKGKKPVAGAKVKITGPGIDKTVKTDKNGKVTVTVKPGKPGIIRVAILDAKTCNTQRIGVVGVYEPPVTG